MNIRRVGTLFILGCLLGCLLAQAKYNVVAVIVRYSQRIIKKRSDSRLVEISSTHPDVIDSYEDEEQVLEWTAINLDEDKD